MKSYLGCRIRLRRTDVLYKFELSRVPLSPSPELVLTSVISGNIPKKLTYEKNWQTAASVLEVQKKYNLLLQLLQPDHLPQYTMNCITALERDDTA